MKSSLFDVWLNLMEIVSAVNGTRRASQVCCELEAVLLDIDGITFRKARLFRLNL